MKLLSNGEARRGVRQPNTTVSSSIASSVGSTSSGSLPTTTVALANPAHTLIGLTDLRNTPRYSDLDGSGLTIAVLDTGIDATHPQLSGNFIGFIDFTDPNVAAETAALITNPALTYDYDLHGTHVAGTAASTDSTVGVATGSDLISLAVLGPNGGSSSSILEALYWVYLNHERYRISVVNMSLGRPAFFASPSEAFQVSGTERIYADLIDSLERVGVAVIVSAGNSYDEKDFLGREQVPGVGTPAIHATVNVGAVWQDLDSQISTGAFLNQQTAGPDRIAFFSNRLDSPDNNLDTLMAPGAMILSTIPDGKYQRLPGTSMASPHLAGIVAILQEAALRYGGRQLTIPELTDILHTTADQIFDGDDENDIVANTQTFYGRVNVLRAVQLIEDAFGASNPVPNPTPTDPNGTLARAIQTDPLTGLPVSALLESIGVDGGQLDVGALDVDFYRIQLDVGGDFFAETAIVNGISVDTVLRLFTATGQQIGFNDDISPDIVQSRLEVAGLQPGVYYLGVSGYNNITYNPQQSLSGTPASGPSSLGTYELRFGIDGTDLNGLLANAADLRLGDENQPTTFTGGLIGTDYGTPVGGSDIDIFRVVIPDDGAIYIDIDTPYDSGYIDSYLRVFDEFGQQVNFVDGSPILSDDDLSYDIEGYYDEYLDARYPGLVFADSVSRDFFVGHATDSFVAANVTRGAVYYIAVSSFDNRSYDPTVLAGRNANGETGAYQLAVQFYSNDRNGSISLSVDVGSSSLLLQSGTIGADTDQTNGLESEVGDIDVDMLAILPSTSGQLTVDVDSYDAALPVSVPVDAVITVFDASGSIIASVDDVGDSFDPSLTFSVVAGQRYYIGVSGYGNFYYDPFQAGSGLSGDVGEYFLSLTYQQTVQVGLDGLLSAAAVQQSPVVLNASPAGQLFRRSGAVGFDGSLYVGSADIDLYRITPQASGAYAFYTEASTDFSSDTFLRLFDSQGNEIAFNDDYNSLTTQSRLEYVLQAGQVYYAGVNGYGSDSRGYNPTTGSGASPGSVGDYDIVFEYLGLPGEPSFALVEGLASRSDRLLGTALAERFIGMRLAEIDQGLTGYKTIDRFTGGGGGDSFVIGDAISSFYDDFNTVKNGKKDYALVTDFSSGDRLELYGSSLDYLLVSYRSSTATGVAIYLDDGTGKGSAFGRLDKSDELVAIITGQAALGLTLDSAQIVYQ